MLSAEALKSSLERLVAGTATDDDRRVVQHAMLAGNIVYAAGERSVAIGGDATGAIIITGDQAQIRLDLDETAYERLKEQTFPTPHGIPPPFPGLIFIGREEALLHIKGLLGIKGASSSQSQQAIVRGWPGVGKTTLVSVLSRDPDIAQAYPDGVLWTSLDQRPALMSILAGWGRGLGRDDLLRVPTPEEAVQQIAAILQRKRMLLIVDDIWEEGHGALFLKARGRDCGLLFTTRKLDVANALAQDERTIYNLPVLTEDDALKLMRILAPDVVNQHSAECRELVRDLECLPLALHVAARLLRKESSLGWGISELLNDIREGAAVIEAQAPPDRVEGEEIPTVKALLQKSTAMLSEFNRECFAYLGAFAPKPATFDLAAMKAVWEVADPKPVVRDLVGHGLLEPVGNGRFQMHALLAMHAKSLCTDS
ncbi:MAG TPA: NB-ARC domain-containing protein [Blastocatellia bacterium]|nr:NB-ARC domain-containing protein [Blastocatellia bacterium]